MKGRIKIDNTKTHRTCFNSVFFIYNLVATTQCRHTWQLNELRRIDYVNALRGFTASGTR